MVRLQVILIYLGLAIVSRPAVAQFEIVKPYWYPETQYKTLYIQVGDTSTEYSRHMMRLIESNWKVCPIEYFSNYIDQKLLQPGNLFLSIQVFTTVSQNMRSNNSYSEPVYNDYFYLHWWTVHPKYRPKRPLAENQFTVARAELFYKHIGTGGRGNRGEYKPFEITENPKSIYSEPIKSIDTEIVYLLTDSRFSDYFLNGKPYNVKNMVQYVSQSLSAQKYRDLFDESSNESELKNLRNDTLYIPDYYLGADGMLSGIDVSEKIIKANEKALIEVFAAYPYKKRIIERNHLEQLIDQSGRTIYYLNYVQSSADKLISVVNSKTGEIVYSNNSKKSYRIKASDMEKLGKAIGK
jgi:hypothetical protein